jgi:hypothetical protein
MINSGFIVKDKRNLSILGKTWAGPFEILPRPPLLKGGWGDFEACLWQSPPVICQLTNIVYYNNSNHHA